MREVPLFLMSEVPRFLMSEVPPYLVEAFERGDRRPQLDHA